MKKSLPLLIALTYLLLPGVDAAGQDEIEFDVVRADLDYAPDEPPLTKDPGPAIDPNTPIITSGDCSDYIDLSGLSLPISATGTTVGASNNYGPFAERPPCWHGDWYDQSCAGPDVAFKWTAPASADYTFSLCATYFDNGLLLYRFTCPDEPSYPDDFICGADDNCVLRGKIRYVHLDEGEEILVVVDGYGNNADDFELRIYESELDEESIDWYMNTQIETFHVPGAAACIVKDGQIQWSGHYGLANIEERRFVEDTTLFTLASISKTVAATAIMQLWEDGLLELDADVNGYLSFDVHNPNYPTIPITIRQLMTHTSSINDNWDILNSLEVHDEDSPIPLGIFLEEYLAPGGAYYDPVNNFNNWAPETESDYCNVGATLAAYLVEVLNTEGLSFDEYSHRYVLDTLDMDRSAWFLPDINLDNLAMPYVWNGSENVPYGQFGHPWYPAGMLRSNTPELARHLISFMQHGQIDDIRVLQDETVDSMMTIHYPDINDRRGLVWYWEYFGLRPVWGHGGAFPGVRTRMFFYPEENTGIVLLTNGTSSDCVNLLTAKLFEYAGGPSGVIAGTVTDPAMNPVDNVYAKTIGYFRFDYSNSEGDYTVGGLIGGTFDLLFRHPNFPDLTIENVEVALGETTYVNAIMGIPCNYVVGDFSGNGIFNIADIIEGFAKLSGGSPEPALLCECPYGGGNSWAVAMDVNNSCEFNLADILDGFSKLATGEPEMVPCQSCPPSGRR